MRARRSFGRGPLPLLNSSRAVRSYACPPERSSRGGLFSSKLKLLQKPNWRKRQQAPRLPNEIRLHHLHYWLLRHLMKYLLHCSFLWRAVHWHGPYHQVPAASRRYLLPPQPMAHSTTQRLHSKGLCLRFGVLITFHPSLNHLIVRKVDRKVCIG